MENIVVIYNDEPRASSVLIARGFKRKHQNVLELIEKHKVRFERFGILPFETGKFRKPKAKGKNKRGRPAKDYMLNEEQATFLGTLFRNSEIVLDFKELLVKDFYKQKRLLQQVITNRHNLQWLQTRAKGKALRLEETDVIKKFVEYAKAQGSMHADWYYKLLTDMQNKALFIVEGKFKNLRDVMSATQLMTIGVADKVIAKAIIDGMKDGIFYKEVYRQAKENMFLFAKLHGQEKIIAEIKQLELKASEENKEIK